MEYLVLPFKLTHDYLGRGDLLQSITHSVGLILSTRSGRMPFYPEYGCSIWDKEYADLYATSKSDVRASLRNAIDMMEKRLYNLSVSFTQENRVEVEALGLHVKVTGNFRDGAEEKKFEAVYHLT
jgi:phage baseplate assembly protein W